MKAAPEVIIEEQLAALAPADRRRYMRLGDAGLHADARVSIFQTNAVALGARGAGVCPTFARLNHGCLGAFNAVYSWQEDQGVIGASACPSSARSLTRRASRPRDEGHQARGGARRGADESLKS